MNSHINKAFRAAFAALPPDVQEHARAAYQLFRENPQHPSLRFRQVHATRPIFSVRIGLHYRALGVREGSDIVWFWIGSHSEYDRLLARG